MKVNTNLTSRKFNEIRKVKSSPGVKDLSNVDVEKFVSNQNGKFIKEFEITSILGIGSYGIALAVKEDWLYDKNFGGINETFNNFCIKISTYAKYDNTSKNEIKEDVKDCLEYLTHLFVILNQGFLFFERISKNKKYFESQKKFEDFFKDLKNLKNSEERKRKELSLFSKKMMSTKIQESNSEIKKLNDDIISYLNIKKNQESNSEIQKLNDDDTISHLNEKENEKDDKIKEINNRVQILIKSYLKVNFNNRIRYIMEKAKIYSTDLKQSLTEIQRLKLAQLKNKNLLTLYTAWKEESRNCKLLFQETKLFSKNLDQARKEIKTREDKEFVLYSIIEGIESMHSLGMVHLDVKALNILVKSDKNNTISEVALCDFGSLSSLFSTSKAKDFETGKASDIEQIKKVAKSFFMKNESCNADELTKEIYNENYQETSLKRMKKFIKNKNKFSPDSRNLIEEIIKENVEPLQIQISDLKDENKKLKDEVTDLKEKFNKSQDENKKLKDEVTILKEEVKNLNAKMSKMIEAMEYLNKKK